MWLVSYNIWDLVEVFIIIYQNFEKVSILLDIEKECIALIKNNI